MSFYQPILTSEAEGQVLSFLEELRRHSEHHLVIGISDSADVDLCIVGEYCETCKIFVGFVLVETEKARAMVACGFSGNQNNGLHGGIA